MRISKLPILPIHPIGILFTILCLLTRRSSDCLDCYVGILDTIFLVEMYSFVKQNKGILLSCTLGILLSYYAYVIETNKEKNESYEAMCDISEHMSCSKAFMSNYGKGFGIIGPLLGETSTLNQPNSIYGMAFYSIVGVLTCFQSHKVAKLQFWLSVISNFGSVYLAYILAFILHDFCVVCVTTYIVNLALLILSLLRYKRLKDVKISHQKIN